MNFRKAYSEYEKTISSERNRNQQNNWFYDFVNPYIGDMEVEEIKRSKIKEIAVTMANSRVKTKYGNLTDRYYKETTIKKVVQMINRVFTFLQDDGVIENNPALKIKIPKNNRAIQNKEKISDPEKAYKDCLVAINEIDSLIHRTFFLMCLNGRRTGEALSLKWEYFNDLSEDSNDNGYRCYIAKSRKWQDFIIEDNAKTALLSLKAVSKSKFVFGKENGKIISYNHYIKTIRLKTGLRTFNAHYLRDISVSYLSTIGVSSEALSSFLGHDDLSSIKTYLHHNPKVGVRQVEKALRGEKVSPTS